MTGFVGVLLALPALAGTPVWLWEGFEREINWEADTGSAATGRTIETAEVTEGAQALRLDWTSPGPGGRAVLEWKESLDWSAYGALVLDVFNGAAHDGLKLTLVLETTDRELRHEISTEPLAPGWNRDIRIDLTAKKFASAAGNWEPRGYLVGRGRIEELSLVARPGESGTGWLVLDQLRLERRGLVTTSAFSVNAAVDGTGSWGNIDRVPTDLRLRPVDLATLESFEDDAPWTPDDDGVTVSRVTSPVSRGAGALQLDFPASPEGVTVELTGLAEKLAGARQLRFDVYNPGRPVTLWLQLTDADDNEYDADAVRLAHGWNTPLFDFAIPGAWEGGDLTDAVLADLASVSITIASLTPGRLIFDGVSAGAIRLRGAGRAGATLRLTWHGTDRADFVADLRTEDTAYGAGFDSIRATRPEAFVDAAAFRLDTGGFRSRALFRKEVTGFDAPVATLVHPDGLDRDYAAVETSGNVLGVQVQALSAGRLRYGRYQRRYPTALGPDAMAGLRARKRFSDALWLGASHVTHLSRYRPEIAGLPRQRRVWAVDAEGAVETGPVKTAWGVAGGLTDGAPEPRPPGVLVRGDDRYLAGGSVSPSLGRVDLSASWSLTGYDFDAAFAKKGGNAELVAASGSVNLDGLIPDGTLTFKPMADGSLGRNLSVGVSAWRSTSRDRELNPDTNMIEPRSSSMEAEASLSNDYTSRPNVNIAAKVAEEKDPWYVTPSTGGNAGLRLPLPFDIIVNGSGAIDRSTTEERATGLRTNATTRSLSAGVERFFTFNLTLHANANWSWTRERYEDFPETRAATTGWTAGARQSIGAATEITIDWGLPPLYGSEWSGRKGPRILSFRLTSAF